jgi:hypothetical protein
MKCPAACGMMIWSGALVLGASLLFASPMTRGDESAVASLALLDRARTLEDLRADGGRPFALHARLKITSPQGQADGSYLLIWVSKNLWHEELHIGDFSRVRDGIDGGYRQIRNFEYEPQVSWDLAGMVDAGGLARLNSKESVGKPRNRKIGGRTLSCTEIGTAGFNWRVLCFDAGAGLLVHATVSSVAGDQEIDFSQEAAIGTKRIPREIRSQRQGGIVLEMAVSDLTPASESTPLPVPDPARSEFWARCADGTPAEVKRREFPRYSEESQMRGEGRVTVYARVETDGTVSHLHLVSASSPDLAQPTMDAVAQFRFSPATCAGIPIRTEILTGAVFGMRP